jgi:N-methylhydantoinase A
MNEISTIGAGGGTIARVGPDGRLRLGPDSAGAKPGPACYGLGGVEPTVTDADFVLGYLDPDSFLGGRFAVQPELARAAVAAHVAAPLGLSVTEAAHSIVRIANSAMESELRLTLMARGHDPKGFAMVAMGGAGPLHGAMVAKSIGLQAVIIPPFPGLGSAMGLLLTDIKHRYIRSLVRLMRDFEPAQIAEIFAGLEERARVEAAAEGTDWECIELQHSMDLRYVGQGYELTIACPTGAPNSAELGEIRASFDRLHERVYGHAAADKEVEIVNFRIATQSALPKLSLPDLAARAPDTVAEAVTGERQAWFEEYGRYVDTKVFARRALAPGHTIVGPAIIEQLDTTIIVLPEQIARPDHHGNLIITDASEAVEARTETAAFAVT